MRVCVCVFARLMFTYISSALLCVLVLETFGDFFFLIFPILGERKERDARASLTNHTHSLRVCVCVCVFVLDAPIRAHFLIRYAHFSRDQIQREDATTRWETTTARRRITTEAEETTPRRITTTTTTTRLRSARTLLFRKAARAAVITARTSTDR